MIQELIMNKRAHNLRIHDHHTPSHSGRMVVPEIFFIQIWYITYRKIGLQKPPRKGRRGIVVRKGDAEG